MDLQSIAVESEVAQIQGNKGELSGELVRQQMNLVRELQMFVSTLQQSQVFMRSLVEQTEVLLRQHQTHLESSVRQTARLVENAQKALQSDKKSDNE